MATTTASGNVNAASLKLGLIMAATVVMKLASGYMVCPLTVTIFYWDLASGAAMLIACCIAPLLALILRRNHTTKKGQCCRGIVMALICLWLLGTMVLACYNAYMSMWSAIENAQSGRLRTAAELNVQQQRATRMDPLNFCSNNNADHTESFFLTNKALFHWIHRGEAVLDIIVTVLWFTTAFASVVCLVKFITSPGNDDDQEEEEIVKRQMDPVQEAVGQLEADNRSRAESLPENWIYVPELGRLAEVGEIHSWKEDECNTNAMLPQYESENNNEPGMRTCPPENINNEDETINGCKQPETKPWLNFGVYYPPQGLSTIEEESTTTPGEAEEEANQK